MYNLHCLKTNVLDFVGLVQDCSISSALAMAILRTCTKTSISERNLARLEVGEDIIMILNENIGGSCAALLLTGKWEPPCRNKSKRNKQSKTTTTKNTKNKTNRKTTKKTKADLYHVNICENYKFYQVRWLYDIIIFAVSFDTIAPWLRNTYIPELRFLVKGSGE